MTLLQTAIVVIGVLSAVINSANGKAKSEESAIIDKLLEDYDKTVPPIGNRPTEISLGINIISFYEVNTLTMDYSLSMYMSQRWRDPALSFRNLTQNLKYIVVPDSRISDFWQPHTYIRNEKSAKLHELTLPNRLLRIRDDGTFRSVMKVSATFSCEMRLERFPFDVHTCEMAFESFSYTSDTMRYSWLETPLSIQKHSELLEFRLVDVRLRDCSQTYAMGNYSCSAFVFVLERMTGYYVIYFYIPTTLLVVLSWMSFWGDIEESSGRLSNGLSIIMSLAVMSVAFNMFLPRVPYIKAADVWLFACVVSVFASLIQNAIVNFLSYRGEQRRLTLWGCWRRRSNVESEEAKAGRNGMLSTDGDDDADKVQKKQSETSQSSDSRKSQDGKRRARLVDLASRCCFPLAFVVFTICYWRFYRAPAIE